MAFSKSGKGQPPKLPTEMLKERSKREALQKAKEEAPKEASQRMKEEAPREASERMREDAPKEPSNELARFRELERSIGRQFYICSRVAQELAEQLDLDVFVYHPFQEEKYNSRWKGTTKFGIHDLDKPTNGGIAVSVDTSDALCNALKNIGFQEYAKDWSTKDRGYTVLLISPWEQGGVNMDKIQSLPEDLKQELNAGPGPGR